MTVYLPAMTKISRAAGRCSTSTGAGAGCSCWKCRPLSRPELEGRTAVHSSPRCVPQALYAPRNGVDNVCVDLLDV